MASSRVVGTAEPIASQATARRDYTPVARFFLAALFTLASTLGAVTSSPSVAQAQGIISGGVGVGGGVGDRNKDASGRGTHGAAYVQFKVPIVPLAFRFDALLAKTADDKTSTSVMADLVYVLGLPFVQPYALVGHGHYGVGRDGSQNGWNAGVGVRVRTPVVALYGEARRHQRVGRDLLTIGISR
ncbi:MAG: outer membrane beta-barrel protein [Gemmatimonas sp.]